eukprot:SAG31_NODE_2853_length_4992_cov_5.719599_2_plen_203_part_00
MAQVRSIGFARRSFVDSSVVDLESDHPDVVEEMLASSVQMFPIGADGVCRSRRSGTVLWAPHVSTAQLTEAFGSTNYGFGSAAAASIAVADGVLTWSEPYCAEMPAAMLELIKAEPDGTVGQSYRRHVRMALLPVVRLVGEILRQHGATIGAAACFGDCNPQHCCSEWSAVQSCKPRPTHTVACRVASVDVAEGEASCSIQH